MEPNNLLHLVSRNTNYVLKAKGNSVKFKDIVDGGKIAAGGLKDFAGGLMAPTVRLGVTGLSRSGKTIFITALVNALLKGQRLPVFEAQAKGRITRCYLEPQPDDNLPRFAFESHMELLTAKDRQWPEGTRRLSQLRLTFEYEPHGIIARNFHGGKLHLDIIDYPGEWLLDLPLMQQTYQQWSNATVAASRKAPRDRLAKDWTEYLTSLDPTHPADELAAVKAAELFTAYLARCRADDVSLSSLPPGRFLMPGDLAGSPLLSFAPLDIAADAELKPGSLAALMARRYDSYVTQVVKPFFYGHFARLDRQIVLVDVLSAMNAGATAVNDLRQTLADVMGCFRLGQNSLMTELFGKRIDRVLFAATKADMLHQSQHDALENIIRVLIDEAAARADFAGAVNDVTAIAAIRTTREATVTQKKEKLNCIAGIPQKGEEIDGTVFDGKKEAAIFTGDLPTDPQKALDGSLEGELQFVRFRPPALKDENFPHIRLDRAVEYLVGDRFK
jgi:uncharacterized protein